MKKKKAIYFNGEYNPMNPAGGAQCITYDEADGFQFIDGDKVITVPTTTDKSQNIEIETLNATVDAQAEIIKTLQDQIKVLNTNAAGGTSTTEITNEDGTKTTVVTVSQITESNYGEAGYDVVLIQTEGVSKPVNIPVTVVANNVTAKNVTINATTV